MESAPPLHHPPFMVRGKERLEGKKWALFTVSGRGQHIYVCYCLCEGSLSLHGLEITRWRCGTLWYARRRLNTREVFLKDTAWCNRPSPLGSTVGLARLSEDQKKAEPRRLMWSKLRKKAGKKRGRRWDPIDSFVARLFKRAPGRRCSWGLRMKLSVWSRPVLCWALFHADERQFTSRQFCERHPVWLLFKVATGHDSVLQT